MSPLSNYYPDVFRELTPGDYDAGTVGEVKRTNRKCSYCEKNTPEYYGVKTIAGMYFLEWACKKCFKKWQKWIKTPRVIGAPRELSSKFGNYMHGCGGQKGGLPGSRSVRDWSKR